MDKLRKENEKLRTDLQATKEEVEKLSKLNFEACNLCTYQCNAGGGGGRA